MSIIVLSIYGAFFLVLGIVLLVLGYNIKCSKKGVFLYKVFVVSTVVSINVSSIENVAACNALKPYSESTSQQESGNQSRGSNVSSIDYSQMDADYEIAMELFVDKKDFNNALTFFKKASQDEGYPNYGMARFMLGYCYLELKNYEIAEEVARELVTSKISDNVYKGAILLVDVCFEEGRYDDALLMSKVIIWLLPFEESSWHSFYFYRYIEKMVKCYDKLGQDDNATYWFELYLNLLKDEDDKEVIKDVADETFIMLGSHLYMDGSSDKADYKIEDLMRDWKASKESD